jgi:hypothetical protein
MPKRSSKKPLPRDVNQMAKSIVELATREATEIPETGDEAKNPAAVALGRLGGLKGGRARAALLTQKQRTAIAMKAAKTRWAGIKRKGK